MKVRFYKWYQFKPVIWGKLRTSGNLDRKEYVALGGRWHIRWTGKLSVEGGLGLSYKLVIVIN